MKILAVTNNMNDLTIRKDFMNTVMTPGTTTRLTKKLEDGRLVILQVADPESDPEYVKWLRKKAEKNKAIRILHAMETAQRVAGCVFRNIMRKKGKNEDISCYK